MQNSKRDLLSASKQFAPVVHRLIERRYIFTIFWRNGSTAFLFRDPTERPGAWPIQSLSRMAQTYGDGCQILLKKRGSSNETISTEGEEERKEMGQMTLLFHPFSLVYSPENIFPMVSCSQRARSTSTFK